MSSDVLLAEYRRQLVVTSRNSSTLLRWAAYTSGLPIPPTKPDPAWVRNRIISERLPEQVDSYTQRTLSFFAQDPQVANNVHPWLHPFNTPETEDQLSRSNDDIWGTAVPRFALTDVSDQQVADWYLAHGFV